MPQPYVMNVLFDGGSGKEYLWASLMSVKPFYIPILLLALPSHLSSATLHHLLYLLLLTVFEAAISRYLCAVNSFSVCKKKKKVARVTKLNSNFQQQSKHYK